jgi:hypothetical protein
MENEHICSMCIKINKVGKQEVGIRWVQKRFPRYGAKRITVSSNLQKYVEIEIIEIIIPPLPKGFEFCTELHKDKVKLKYDLW